jgi:hypothetical protein
MAKLIKNINELLKFDSTTHAIAMTQTPTDIYAVSPSLNWENSISLRAAAVVQVT